MVRIRRLVAAVVSILWLSGCVSQPSRGDATDPLTQVRNDLRRLSESHDKLAAELKRFQAQVLLDQINAEISRRDRAVFNPISTDGFARLDTEVGTLVVSIEDITSFGDGARVRLHVGNLTSATISGGQMKVKWGPRPPQEGTPEYTTASAQWEKVIQEKSVALTRPLRSGVWNVVDLTLPGTPPAVFGYLEVAIDAQQISLGVRP